MNTNSDGWDSPQDRSVHARFERLVNLWSTGRDGLERFALAAVLPRSAQRGQIRSIVYAPANHSSKSRCRVWSAISALSAWCWLNVSHASCLKTWALRPTVQRASATLRNAMLRLRGTARAPFTERHRPPPAIFAQPWNLSGGVGVAAAPVEIGDGRTTRRRSLPEPASVRNAST